MSTPLSLMLACHDTLPNASCSGFAGAGWDSFEYLDAAVWVSYSVGDAGAGACAGNFAQVALLPPGAFICAAADDGSAVDIATPASNYMWGSGAAFTPPFDITQLDGPTILQAYAAGFVLVGMAWALGQAVGAIMRVVRR